MIEPNPEGLHAKDTISRLMNGKDQEWEAVINKPGPLQLLDLPNEILKDVVAEVTHTNDLTALALCCSALHNLAIPNIYSRFDIVWPDEHADAEPRAGVDALTYGLATLVMAHEVFGHTSSVESLISRCYKCGQNPGPHSSPQQKRLRGNNYAQYTRKFSLGNGPSEWVQDYRITKEGGKMLGTLVALAVARMRNLESFIWDMPTGVLRDVWLALSSLGEREDGQESRLDRLWIRWHDNRVETPHISATSNNSNGANAGHQSSVNPANSTATTTTLSPNSPTDRVEQPTFSIVPPVRSLSVLEIDELAYLDEMAILIGHSVHRIRELRVGIASHVRAQDWVSSWEGEATQEAEEGDQEAKSSSTKRVGGILGTLFSRVFLPYPPRNTSPDTEAPVVLDETSVQAVQESFMPAENAVKANAVSTDEDLETSQPPSPTTVRISSPRIIEPLSAPNENLEVPANGIVRPTNDDRASAQDNSRRIRRGKTSITRETDTKFGLEILELERVPPSISLMKAILDSSKLTDLTILDCPGHENLWKRLARSYTPKLHPLGTNHNSEVGFDRRPKAHEYPLKLRKVHVNAVSQPLLKFLTDTLAPNTLQTLFLQQGRTYSSHVKLDKIFRGPLRRHRESLEKLSIDGTHKTLEGRIIVDEDRWMRWIVPFDVIKFLLSTKTPQLRELCICIDHHDWHSLLQRLPYAAQLRSLYFPFIKSPHIGEPIDSKDLALQIVDIITLCPKINLCYLGITSKCFEILEVRPGCNLNDADDGPTPINNGDNGDDENDENDEEDDGGDNVDGDDEDDEEADTESEPSLTEDEQSDIEEDKSRTRVRLREILFYDDKVSIFKARHGRL